MDQRYLEYILVLAETGNMTRAAQKLYISAFYPFHTWKYCLLFFYFPSIFSSIRQFYLILLSPQPS